MLKVSNKIEKFQGIPEMQTSKEIFQIFSSIFQ